MTREERTAKRKATREEAKEDAKDLATILHSLVERYGSEKAALKESVEILLATAAYLAQISQPELEPPYKEIMRFLINTVSSDGDNENEASNDTPTILLP